MRRSAFTITEVLVSLAVIGLLMSIIVPAVQSARASARLVDCRNRLKQVGLAVHIVQDSEQIVTCNYDELYHIGMSHPGYSLTGPSLFSFDPVAFKCPSDVNAVPGSPISYTMSIGTSFSEYNGYYKPGLDGGRHIADFVDGQSSTVAFSERVVVSVVDQVTPRDDRKKFPAWIPTRISGPGMEQQFVDACLQSQNSSSPLRSSNDSYHSHLLTPNSRGCWNAPPTDPNPPTAFMPPSSYHSSGVNVLFVDGHVTFVPDMIDQAIWSALGSINGSETDHGSF